MGEVREGEETEGAMCLMYLNSWVVGGKKPTCSSKNQPMPRSRGEGFTHFTFSNFPLDKNRIVYLAF